MADRKANAMEVAEYLREQATENYPQTVGSIREYGTMLIVEIKSKPVRFEIATLDPAAAWAGLQALIEENA